MQRAVQLPSQSPKPSSPPQLVKRTKSLVGVAVRYFIFAVAFCPPTLSSTLADVRILASPGGAVGNYLNFFSQVRRSGERVIIDGPCLSACTLVLSTIPRNRICVTSRAVLGFHAAPDR